MYFVIHVDSLSYFNRYCKSLIFRFPYISECNVFDLKTHALLILLLQRVRIRCCRCAFFHASDFASGGVPAIPIRIKSGEADFLGFSVPEWLGGVIAIATEGLLRLHQA